VKAQILNHKIFVEPETQSNNKVFHVSKVPTLRISDFCNTIWSTLSSTREMIKFHTESLVDGGIDVPSPDSPDSFFVINQKVDIQTSKK